MTNINYGWQKATLLFLALVVGGIAEADPFPFPHAAQWQVACSIAYKAFAGSFLWLLQPPQPKNSGTEPEEPQQ